MIGATVIWGLSPLYYKQLVHLDPGEVLAHRTLWSLVFFGGVLLVQGRLQTLPGLLRSHFWLLTLASMMISVNWFGFIFAIGAGRAVEASMGYFIYPLVAVLIGYAALGERLNRWQGGAIVLAAMAVLTLSFGLGVVPVLSLILASSFGVYGLVKKQMNVGPVQSVSAEVLILAPIALGWLIWLYSAQGQGRPMPDASTWALLAVSGPLTAGPLILFSFGARRVRMATVGVVQYLNPTLQFLCAVLVFHEPMTQWHIAAFGLIWLGLAIYAGNSLAQDRAARRAARKSVTPQVVVT